MKLLSMRVSSKVEFKRAIYSFYFSPALLIEARALYANIS